MKHKIKVFIEKIRIKIWKHRNKRDYVTLDILTNDLRELRREV